MTELKSLGRVACGFPGVYIARPSWLILRNLYGGLRLPAFTCQVRYARGIECKGERISL